MTALFFGPLRPEDLPFIKPVAVAEVPRCCFVASGYHAIRLLVRSLRLAPGSKVALPALICPTVVSALQAEQMMPAFVDITPDSLVMDFDEDRFFNAHYDLIILPHLYGLLHPQTREIMDFAHNTSVPLIHDAAQSYGVELDGIPIIHYNQGGLISFGPGKATTAATGALVCGIDAQIRQELALGNWRRWDLFSGDFMRRRMGMKGKDFLLRWQSHSFQASSIQVWAACRVMGQFAAIEQRRRQNWQQLLDLIGHELHGVADERASYYKFILHSILPFSLPEEFASIPVRRVVRYPVPVDLPVYQNLQGEIYEISTERSVAEYRQIF